MTDIDLNERVTALEEDTVNGNVNNVVKIHLSYIQS